MFTKLHCNNLLITANYYYSDILLNYYYSDILLIIRFSRFMGRDIAMMVLESKTANVTLFQKTRLFSFIY